MTNLPMIWSHFRDLFFGIAALSWACWHAGMLELVQLDVLLLQLFVAHKFEDRLLTCVGAKWRWLVLIKIHCPLKAWFSQIVSWCKRCEPMLQTWSLNIKISKNQFGHLTTTSSKGHFCTFHCIAWDLGTLSSPEQMIFPKMLASKIDTNEVATPKNEEIQTNFIMMHECLAHLFFQLLQMVGYDSQTGIDFNWNASGLLIQFWLISCFHCGEMIVESLAIHSAPLGVDIGSISVCHVRFAIELAGIVHLVGCTGETCPVRVDPTACASARWSNCMYQCVCTAWEVTPGFKSVAHAHEIHHNLLSRKESDRWLVVAANWQWFQEKCEWWVCWFNFVFLSTELFRLGTDMAPCMKWTETQTEKCRFLEDNWFCFELSNASGDDEGWRQTRNVQQNEWMTARQRRAAAPTNHCEKHLCAFSIRAETKMKFSFSLHSLWNCESHDFACILFFRQNTDALKSSSMPTVFHSCAAAAAAAEPCKRCKKRQCPEPLICYVPTIVFSLWQWQDYDDSSFSRTILDWIHCQPRKMARLQMTHTPASYYKY